MKKIAIFGGSGFIGKNLIAKLKQKDCFVINFTRNATKYVANIDENIQYSINSNNWKTNLEGTVAVINLAGATIASKRWTNSYKKIIYNSRIETTELIVNTINKLNNKPEIFINASAVGYYGNCENEIITEQSHAGNDFLSKVCIDWENSARKIHKDIRLVIPRIGFVLDKNEGGLAKMLLPFKLFIGGPLGSGKQFIPWIHKNDLINLINYFIENSNCYGEFNCSAPNPITMKEFAIKIGKILKRPSFFTVPSFALKTLLGEQSSIILNSCRAIPEKALKTDYKFEFDTIDKALQNLLANK